MVGRRGPEGFSFRHSTFCTNGGCVEVAVLADGRVAVRDGKDPHGPSLLYSADEWRGFVLGVKEGEFDV